MTKKRWEDQTSSAMEKKGRSEGNVASELDGKSSSLSLKNATEHVKQLQRLQEKDPEFYQYLKDHDKELLEFNDEDIDGDEETDLEVDEGSEPGEKIQKEPQKAITTAMVDSWCMAIKEEGKLSAVRSLLRAFRTACHYGDDSSSDATPKFSIISSSVFNRIMVFVLNEMDGILRGVLHAPSTGGKKETIMELTTTKAWKKNGSLMRIYLGNALHILTEMTDEQMISFTLKRVKASAVFLAAYPTLLRKYIKVALHSWGTGRGALPVVSFLFLRDLCVRLGSDCIDTCLKGVYKAYVMNCKLSKSVSRSKQQHVNFLGNCVTELYGVDISSAYQHAFVFIRQLAMILRSALTERGNKVVKENKDKKQQEGNKNSKQHMDKAYQKVYDWQFIYCLELWTGVICAYNAESDFRPLAYPLTQIISGVASLVPTARFFPLRLRCVRMLNRLAGATGTFIPVSAYLLDMLEMKELNVRPVGGVGKAVNLLIVKQVDKATLNTRAFQEACIYSVVDELTEHLAQWSYSPAFFELSFVPVVRLRSFCKCTDADRCRREVRELIRKVDDNSGFTNSKRLIADFSPNEPAVESFLEVEKKSGSSPLSQHAAELRLRAQLRSDSMVESSVIVGAESSVFSSKLPEMKEAEGGGDEEEAASVFSSSWLPEKKSKVTEEKAKASKKRSHQEYNVEGDEDLVEDLVLSSDEEDDDDDQPMVDSASEGEEYGSNAPKRKQVNKKRDQENGFKRAKRKRLNKKQKRSDSSNKQNGGKETTAKNPNKRKRPKPNARYGKKKSKV